MAAALMGYRTRGVIIAWGGPEPCMRTSSTHIINTPPLVSLVHGFMALHRYCGGSSSRGRQQLQERFGALTLQIASTSYVCGGLCAWLWPDPHTTHRYVSGGLGAWLWPAARCLCEWMVANTAEAKVAGARVLELSAGLGAPAIVAACLGAEQVSS